MSRNNTSVSRRTHPSTTTVDTAVVIAVIVVIATKVEVVAEVDTAVATTIVSSIIRLLLALQARLPLPLPRALLLPPLLPTTVPSTPSIMALLTPMLPTVDTRTTSHTTSTISKWPRPSSKQMALLRLLLPLARPLLHLLAPDPHHLRLLVRVAATARYVVRMSFVLVLITDIWIAGPPTPWSLNQKLFWWVNVVPSAAQSHSFDIHGEQKHVLVVCKTRVIQRFLVVNLFLIFLCLLKKV